MLDMACNPPAREFTYTQKEKPVPPRNGTKPPVQQKHARSQLLALQQRLLQMAKQDLKPRELAGLAVAWDKLEQTRHILVGFGRPRAVTARNDKEARAKVRRVITAYAGTEILQAQLVDEPAKPVQPESCGADVSSSVTPSPPTDTTRE